MAKLLKFRKIISFFFGMVVLFGGIFSPVGFDIQNGGNLTIDVASAANQTGTSVSWEDFIESEGYSCNIASWNFTFGGCMVLVLKDVYAVVAFLLVIFAKFFDVLLMFSISDKFLDQEFIGPAWTALRDAANMLFIFLLVIISISIILDYGSFKSKELIVKVIMIAIAINFSLFVSRVVIDAGNIFTVGFYDAIGAKDMEDTYIAGIIPKEISSGLMSMFNPVEMMDQEAFHKWVEGEGDKTAIMIVIFLVAIAIAFYTAYVFFMAGWTFIGRVIYLWMLMVLSPLAFMSYAIPGMGSYFTKWWQKLLDKSFCVVVFLFILWLLFLINDNGLFASNNFVEGDNILGQILVILMKAMIVFAFMRTALSELKKKCDDGVIGDSILKGVKGAVGLAGIATGGALVGAGAKALGGNLMRGTVGRAAQRGAEYMEKKGGGTSTMGKLGLKTLRNVGDSKFGMAKESFKAREDSKVKDHHAYANTLSKEKNITANELDAKGKPVRDAQGNIKKTNISAQDQYYRNISKSKISNTVAATAGAATVATGGVLAPLTVPLADYMRTRATTGAKAAEQQGKISKLNKDKEIEREKFKLEIEKLKNEELREAEIHLQEAKDDLEKAKLAKQPESALSIYRSGVGDAQVTLSKANSEIKKKEEELKEKLKKYDEDIKKAREDMKKNK
ncbi:TPA: hypothetical protein DCZ46_01205 [Candidatus Campbellbacteria bacterium]|nr:MAG: seg [Candidatus Campbellbacteria bacterium GW2011_OD1_34_28]KKP75297.1 MAG: hypothetical protein UR74_C0001G0153 [Candidatus Campbellbacteria bacterium GW2011_GWD2_35_24]KKP76142.1 MAG: hypothetical protein UR75_C0001G0176 [Candidatus Campbellbacteria bacterium GW2011_GWC2_35_28]KKP77331.1 MAG: hypothetical protein UR76_C0001G0176 [Candidatus Campbellbacteria bacterium GW2011_GWC1_35_31]KKP79260.1 MAG: hypothetical protein UR79_C0001G0176 [Candidatus Campbellbacteria bacterium GW2011_GW